MTDTDVAIFRPPWMCSSVLSVVRTAYAARRVAVLKPSFRFPAPRPHIPQAPPRLSMTSSQGQTSQTGAGRMGSVCSAFAVAVVISVASVPTAAAERRCSEHGKYLAEFANRK
jgi:hypothetical protein